jgi:hypothetical protein
MVDSQYKRVSLDQDNRTSPEAPPGWNVRGNAPLERAELERIQSAQDHALGGFRPVLTYHTGGLTAGWPVPDAAPSGSSHPDNSTWRTMQRSIVVVAPGADLECRMIALPSGGEDTTDGYDGAVRFGAKYDNGANSDSITYRQVPIPVSPEANGAVGTSDSWDWFNLHHAMVGKYRPGAPSALLNATRTKWSEFSTATMQLDVRAGARVLCANITELPGNHVHEHDSDVATVHAYRENGQPTKHPQESQADGATYEERRYGTHRMLDVAERQSERLGPILWTWTAHTEQLTEPSDSEADPFVSTGTSFVSVFDSSVTAWSADEPGFSVCASYARRDKEHATLPRAGAIPVLVRVRHETTVGGTVRIQVSARSWLDVDLPVTTGYEWTLAAGFLESDPAPDVNRTNGMAFVKHDSGGSVNLRYIVVEYDPSGA